MYQLKAQNGYEIQVIGNLCRVGNKNNDIVFEGTYDACEKWLNDRGVRLLSQAKERQEQK